MAFAMQIKCGYLFPRHIHIYSDAVNKDLESYLYGLVIPLFTEVNLEELWLVFVPFVQQANCMIKIILSDKRIKLQY